MKFRYPIADLHIHAFSLPQAQDVLQMANELHYVAYNLLSATSLGPRFAANNFLVAEMKLRDPGRAYAFAGFNYPETGTPNADDFLAQAQRFRAIGFDGIKMMDGKPNIRRRLATPLDDPVYDPMFDDLEETGTPVVYHVNDPWEFWHWDKMPQWAQASPMNVFYGDGNHPHKEQIETEILRLIAKHPRLKIILAHFFFTANDLEHTVNLFETYPNLCYDITPGWEMFESFAERRDEWIAFFERYRTRIFFGTDTTSKHWRTTIANLIRVLESEDRFESFEEACWGLNLSEEVSRDLYLNNFQRLLPNPPKPIDLDALLAEFEKQRAETVDPEAIAEMDEIGAILRTRYPSSDDKRFPESETLS